MSSHIVNMFSAKTPSPTKEVCWHFAVEGACPRDEGQCSYLHAEMCWYFDNYDVCPRDEGQCPYVHHLTVGLHGDMNKEEKANATLASKTYTAPSTPVSKGSRRATEVGTSPSSKVSVHGGPSIPPTSPVSTIVSTGPPPCERHWDTNGPWQQWALKNFRSATTKKLLAPYMKAFDSGTVNPREYLKMCRSEEDEGAVFHFFPSLPLELRELIWIFALNERQTQCRVRYDREIDGSGRHFNKRYLPLIRSPDYLRVNRETRELCIRLNYYEKAFGTKQNPEPLSWFNFENDRLLLATRGPSDYEMFLRSFLRKDGKRVLHLAIPLKDLMRGKLNDMGTLIAIVFPNLESLDVLAGDGREDAQWTRDPQIRKKMPGWFREIWLVNHPKAIKTPTIGIELIPEHIAQVYGINGFNW